MKKTYPGQSKKLVTYSIGTTGVSFVIVGFPTFFSTIDRQVMIYQSTSTDIIPLKPQTSTIKKYYKAQEGYVITDTTTFKPKLFLKGTINNGRAFQSLALFNLWSSPRIPSSEPPPSPWTSQFVNDYFIINSTDILYLRTSNSP